ncbi:MAG TPA: sigma-70 family RNA polymerase sigma factor [Thermoanaerobaculia bacterium]|nr:sigma-70 family RNA polymerase sigma factor [Thermoanaerobaculia bacterium]
MVTEMAIPQPSILTAPASAESELVSLARSGDAAACDELARRFRQPAYLLALQLLGDQEDALDVAQDSLLRFFTKLHRFRSGLPVKPWLLSIVRNRALDLVRRKKVRRAEPLENEEGDYRPELIDHGVDPETDYARRELKERLWRALGLLPANQREILVLRDYQDLSYAEIARVLDVPVGTVMSRLHRARAGLRVLLEREGSAGFPRSTAL